MAENCNAWTPSIKLPEGSRWDVDKDGCLCVVTHEGYGDVITPGITNQTYRDVNAALVAAYDQNRALVSKYNEEHSKEPTKFVPSMFGKEMERLDAHNCWRLKICGHEYFLRDKFYPWVSYLGGSDCAPIWLNPIEDDVKANYFRQLRWLEWRACEHAAEFRVTTCYTGDTYKLGCLRGQFAADTTVKEEVGTSSASGSIFRDMRANALLAEIHKLEEEKAQLLKQVAEGTAVRPLVNIEPVAAEEKGKKCACEKCNTPGPGCGVDLMEDALSFGIRLVHPTKPGMRRDFEGKFSDAKKKAHEILADQKEEGWEVKVDVGFETVYSAKQEPKPETVGESTSSGSTAMTVLIDADLEVLSEFVQSVKKGKVLTAQTSINGVLYQIQVTPKEDWETGTERVRCQLQSTVANVLDPILPGTRLGLYCCHRMLGSVVIRKGREYTSTVKHTVRKGVNIEDLMIERGLKDIKSGRIKFVGVDVERVGSPPSVIPELGEALKAKQ